VEDETYRGPWAGVNSIGYKILNNMYDGSYLESPDWTKHHPGPCEDTKLANKLYKLQEKVKNYLFGFESLTQYSNWFYTTQSRQMLYNSGYRLYMYDCVKEHCLLGNKQVMFKKEYAEKLNEVNLFLF